jgi:hypothetical protein
MDHIANDLRRSEEALLDPAVRKNRTSVEKLLAEDFLEFGSSGRVWTREQVFDLLAGETYTSLQMEDFDCALIGEDVALVTYRAVRIDPESRREASTLRSSIWTQKSGTWRLRFHQGTRMP